MTGLFAAALERAQGFLIAPAPTGARDNALTPSGRRNTVGVVGLRRGSGASTVARGLACVLEEQDPEASSLVWHLAPAELERAAVDVTVLVAPGDGEPALASIAAGLLRTRVGPVIVVANRVRDPHGWSGRAAVCLPDSRLAAMVIARGHLPPGELGAGLVRVAAAVGAATEDD